MIVDQGLMTVVTLKWALELPLSGMVSLISV